VKKTVFELQSVDWHTQQPIPSRTLLAQMQRLRTLGALNFGYYPDNLAADQPSIDTLRDVMSLKSRLDPGSINALMDRRPQGTLVK